MNQMTPWSPMPLPGCSPSPCFDPNALLQCYSELGAMSALVEKIVLNLLATDPAFTQAFVDAIAKSGSNIPLVGVTNGTAAQPGQVGEFIEFAQHVTFGPGTGAGSVIQTVTMGVLQPGDWDCYLKVQTESAVNGLIFELSPMPAGFSGPLQCLFQVPSEAITLEVGAERGLISVPTLIPVYLYTDSTAGGSCDIFFAARRAR